MPAGLWNPAPENIGTGWPGPPQYNAPNIGSLVGDILKNRQFEQLNMQNQISGLGKAIQAQQQNQAFGEAASNAGLLPGVDTTNMSADQISNLAQRIQQQGSEASLDTYRKALGAEADARTKGLQEYPTDVGGGTTIPLTPEQQVEILKQKAILQQRAQYYNQGGYYWDDTLQQWVQPKRGGGVQVLPQFAQPTVQAQKSQAQDEAQQSAITKNLAKFNLTPDDLTTPRDYGTAQVNPADKTGSTAKPNTFVATQPGAGAQPWVRITPQGGGGQVVMPRTTYEYFRNALQGPPLPPGVQPTPTPGPSAAPATTGGVGITPTPIPGTTPPSGGSGPGPTDQAVAALRADPTLAQQFDQKYGAGSSAQFLGP